MTNFKGTIFPTQYPSGTWGFVGSVPAELDYTLPDGSPLPPTLTAMVAHVGPGIFARAGEIKAVRFDTKEAAVEAAKALGYVEVEPGDERKGMRAWTPPPVVSSIPKHSGGPTLGYRGGEMSYLDKDNL